MSFLFYNSPLERSHITPMLQNCQRPLVELIELFDEAAGGKKVESVNLRAPLRHGLEHVRSDSSPN